MGPEATRACQLVKKRARQLRGLPPAFVGFWCPQIAVVFQRDVAQSSLRIKDGAVQPNPTSRLHYAAIDLGTRLARRSLDSILILAPNTPSPVHWLTRIPCIYHGCLPPDYTTSGFSWLHLTNAQYVHLLQPSPKKYVRHIA